MNTKLFLIILLLVKGIMACGCATNKYYDEAIQYGDIVLEVQIDSIIYSSSVKQITTTNGVKDIIYESKRFLASIKNTYKGSSIKGPILISFGNTSCRRPEPSLNDIVKLELRDYNIGIYFNNICDYFEYIHETPKIMILL